MIFCGRSGSDTLRAQPRRLVENLKLGGTAVEVAREDFVCREDVVQAFEPVLYWLGERPWVFMKYYSPR